MSNVLGYRVSDEEKIVIEQKVKEFGFESNSDFIKAAIDYFLLKKNEEKKQLEVEEERKKIAEILGENSSESTANSEEISEEISEENSDENEKNVSKVDKEFFKECIEKFALSVTNSLKDYSQEINQKQDELSGRIENVEKVIQKLDFAKYKFENLEKLNQIATDSKTTRNRLVRLMGFMEMCFHRMFRHSRNIIEVLSHMTQCYDNDWDFSEQEGIPKCIEKADNDLNDCFDNLFTRSHNYPDFDLWRDTRNDNVCTQIDGGYNVEKARKNFRKRNPKMKEIPESLRDLYYNDDAGNNDRADTDDKV